MRITLEPSFTEAPPEWSREDTWVPQHSVSIEVLSDDIDVYDTWDTLIRPALVAYGFSPESIEQCIERMYEPD